MASTITDYDGKVAVVTGGASGIGRGIVEELLKQGAKVVVADIEKNAVDATVADAAALGEVSSVATDVTKPESVEALADAVYEKYAVCHLLFNNAGIGAPGANVWETTPNDWTWTFTVNVFGVAYGIQSFVPRMLAGGEPGHIVNTSSGDGAIEPMPFASIYAASKAAVATMTECLAFQLEDQGTMLRASLFLPGGRGLLATGLWTSERNRPPELARERPRPTKPQTIETLKEQAKAAGRELPIQDLNELGRDVLAQLKTGVYCIHMNGNEANAQRLHARADRFAQGLNPTAGSH
jgi:NAD(P)-dependent dehydrogenase (short-subunit alcohol dehydrogenase family)